MASIVNLDVHTEIEALARRVQWLLRRALAPIAILLVLETLYLAITGHRAALGFGYISLGSCFALALWNARAIGLPLLPVFVFQHLIAFGLPIATGHVVLRQYPTAYLTDAGFEVLVFCASLGMSWWVAMQLIIPSAPVSHALKGFRQGASARLKTIGLALMIGSSGVQIAQSLSALDGFYAALPAGGYSVALSILATASTCGFFLVGMFVGSGAMSIPGRLLFWTLLTANCAISASGFLLSAPATIVASAALGLFWSTGRIPWRFLTIVVLLLSFFNLGKFTMRERYWQEEDAQIPHISLTEIPRYYLEWADASIAMLGADERPDAFGRPGLPTGRQTLLERINNLQNLLFVMRATDADHIPTLDGATYTLIPALLVPRIIWPEKPRTHEGQVTLNVHFGRQDLSSTFTTYVAWGLLAEAYGNFGAITGALVLGLCLGVFCAWVENFSARKLLLSLEGFLAFTLLLSVINSFEMVASVLITTVFQALIPILFASLPFVERVNLGRRASAE